ncbi:MAG: hypothetical protein NC827_07430 [Candidatus Omnitrophica bacterium]|nr:hypothetical protein [Candidatus Omnitrophota bacterium]MCM8803122.1 hypothetical protein [Candidatus Omnitrophota bacterium]
MKKICLIFYIFQFFIFSEYRYLLNLSCENEKFLRTIKIASFNFISGKEKYNVIKIVDDRGRECKILGVNFLKNEIEVFFNPTDSCNYKVFIGYDDKKKEYEQFRSGKILIDDYIPPDSIKSGAWLWVEKSLSGLYSHTGTSGFSFHRVSFRKQFSVNPDDKIVTYVFIEDDNVEEIMVEVVSRYRKHYYFSFGQDKIDIKGINKEKIGELPEKGKWVKIEVPLLKIRERNLEGIGFYNDKGKVYWDLTSINEIPVKMKIVKAENLISPNTPYFNYEVEGPFKIKDKKIIVLKLDASCFSADRYLWEIDEKNYYGEKVNLKLYCEKKEIDLKLKAEKNKGYGEFSHKINIEEEKEINFNFNILPFESFIYEDEILYIPVRIENMSEIPVKYNLLFQSNNQELFLLPGKENGKTTNLSLNLKDEIKIKLYFYDIELAEKIIKVLSLDDKNYFIDGPFLRKENSYIIFKVPEYKNIKKEEKFSKIIFIGNFPEDLVEFLKEKGFEVLSIKEEKYTNFLFAEFKFIQENLNKIEKDNSFIILFPFLNSLLRRHKINEWEKVYDGILYLLSQKNSNIILCSPFPSYPYLEIFQPYREKIKKISEKRGFYFLDLYKIFSEIGEGERFFKLNEYVYKNFPDKEGFEIVLKEIEKIMKNEKGINNQGGSAR